MRAEGGKLRDWIQAEAALRTCSTVRCSAPVVFFSPLEPLAGAEQMTELGDVQVAMNAPPAANLEVIHAQFVFGLLEAAFDGPA